MAPAGRHWRRRKRMWLAQPLHLADPTGRRRSSLAMTKSGPRKPRASLLPGAGIRDGEHAAAARRRLRRLTAHRVAAVEADARHVSKASRGRRRHAWLEHAYCPMPSTWPFPQTDRGSEAGKPSMMSPPCRRGSSKGTCGAFAHVPGSTPRVASRVLGRCGCGSPLTSPKRAASRTRRTRNRPTPPVCRSPQSWRWSAVAARSARAAARTGLSSCLAAPAASSAGKKRHRDEHTLVRRDGRRRVSKKAAGEAAARTRDAVTDRLSNNCPEDSRRNLGQFGPNSAGVDKQVYQRAAEIGPASAENATSWPSTGQSWPKSYRNLSNSHQVGQNLDRVGTRSTGIDQIWSQLAVQWPKSGRIRPESGENVRIWP